MVVDVREDKRARVPAVTHVDDTTRPQTVAAAVNPELPPADLPSSTG